MAMKEYVQGDSISRDISSLDVSEFGPTWTGVWVVAPEIGDTPICTGTITKSPDSKVMQVRITPEQSADLPVSTVYIIAQIENATIGYRKEVIQEKIRIKKQGIVL